METHTNIRNLNRVSQQLMNIFEYAEIPVNMFKYISTIHQWIIDPNQVLFNFLDLSANNNVSD